MPPTLTLALFVIQEAITLEPAIAAAIKDLFAKTDPTPQDWADLRAKLASKSYADYVPDSALTAGTAVPVVTMPPAATPDLTATLEKAIADPNAVPDQAAAPKPAAPAPSAKPDQAAAPKPAAPAPSAKPDKAAAPKPANPHEYVPPAAAESGV